MYFEYQNKAHHDFVNHISNACYCVQQNESMSAITHFKQAFALYPQLIDTKEAHREFNDWNHDNHGFWVLYDKLKNQPDKKIKALELLFHMRQCKDAFGLCHRKEDVQTYILRHARNELVFTSEAYDSFKNWVEQQLDRSSIDGSLLSTTLAYSTSSSSLASCSP